MRGGMKDNNVVIGDNNVVIGDKNVVINDIHDIVYNVTNPGCINIRKNEEERNKLIDMLKNLYKEDHPIDNQKIYRYIECLNMVNDKDRTSFIHDGVPSKSLTDDEKKSIIFVTEHVYTENIQKLKEYNNNLVENEIC